MLSGFKDILFGIVLVKVLVVESFFDVMIEVCLEGRCRIDVLLGKSPVLSRFLVESSEKDAGGDVLPGDILDRHQIDTGFHEKGFDIGSPDIIDEILLEGIHEIFEPTFFLVSFGSPVEDHAELLDIEVFFGFVGLGYLECFFFELAYEAFMSLLPLLFSFLPV